MDTHTAINKERKEIATFFSKKKKNCKHFVWKDLTGVAAGIPPYPGID